MTEKRWKIHEIKDRGWGLYDLIDTEKNRKYQFDVTDRGIRELVVTLLNEQHEENEQLKSDKEHLMGCLIRFFGYDDEDIDYNLNRESNREYGKQYYSMKEETKKELEE